MEIETGRFGKLKIQEEDKVHFPQGIIGFPQFKDFCLVDPGDETLILWLQSLDDMRLAFPILEPKIFRPDYKVHLSPSELRELQVTQVNDLAVFGVLTIPEDVTQMSANIKAPIVINMKTQRAKQVVLQENDYSIKHLMFKELRLQLLTIQSQKKQIEDTALVAATLRVKDLPATPSITELPMPH